MLNQLLMSLIDISCKVGDLVILFLTLFAECHVDALNTEVACDGHSSIDVVAEALKKLGGLCLDHNGLLLVTGVQSQVYEFLRVVIHLLSLSFCGLYKIKSDIKHQIWQETEENLLEVVILGGETQVFQSFNHEVADGLLIE